MCGRYRLAKDWAQIERRFGAKLADATKPLDPRYNIAPTDEVVAIRRRKDHEQPEVELLRWGLVPHWAKDTKGGAKMINARAESLMERPAFRSLVETHRCLIPAEGFYEWRTNPETGKREPFDLTLENGDLFAFAGLWAARKDDAANEWLVSCTIITTKANQLVAKLHDRMPVILPRDAEADWLDPDISVDHAMSLLDPYPAEGMRMRQVSSLINSVKNDGPELLEPPADSAAVF